MAWQEHEWGCQGTARQADELGQRRGNCRRTVVDGHFLLHPGGADMLPTPEHTVNPQTRPPLLQRPAHMHINVTQGANPTYMDGAQVGARPQQPTLPSWPP